MPYGQHHMINNRVVTSPDEEVWNPILVGDSLAGTQRRSPYQILEWRKQVADQCRLDDWFAYDNTILAALVCSPPGTVNQWQRYTDAICQSVGLSKRHGIANEVVARFMVNVG